MPEPRSDNEAHRSVGLQIIFDHQGFLNMHLNLSKRAFLHFAPIEMLRNPRLPALQLNATATGLPQWVRKKQLH